MARVLPNTQLVADVSQSWFTESSESENVEPCASVYASHAIGAGTDVDEVLEAGMYVPSTTTVHDEADASKSVCKAARVGSGVSATARGEEYSRRSGGRWRRCTGSPVFRGEVGLDSVGLGKRRRTRAFIRNGRRGGGSRPHGGDMAVRALLVTWAAKTSVNSRAAARGCGVERRVECGVHCVVRFDDCARCELNGAHQRTSGDVCKLYDGAGVHEGLVRRQGRHGLR
eukprot:4262752-Pleurochrysis_carterae.AAC.1